MTTCVHTYMPICRHIFCVHVDTLNLVVEQSMGNEKGDTKDVPVLMNCQKKASLLSNLKKL